MRLHSKVMRTNALGSLAAMLVSCALVMAPGVGAAEIIWSGDYRTGNFLQWHDSSDTDSVTFHTTPEYGRPIQYGGQPPEHVGDGSLLSLVAATERTVDGIFYPAGPTRGTSQYAAKFTVKSDAAGGVEPDDCDVPFPTCKRRRTELSAQGSLPLFYDALPYQSERWMSVSIYTPSDWDSRGSSWGPIVWNVKPLNDGGGQGSCLSISLEPGDGWEVRHRWTDVANLKDQVPWQQHAPYSPTLPKADGSDSYADLRDDFPDQLASQKALKLAKGEWTDWVVHMKFDARGSLEGGTGFLDVWNRAGSGPWVKVLEIVPKVVTVGGLTFDRGICYNSPPYGSKPGGFGIKAGMYMDARQVWDLPNDRVLYNANIKVGSENATFADMSPDGSSPGSAPSGQNKLPPKPPTIIN